MIGSISSLAAQAGGTASIKAASETSQVFNTSKNQWAPSPQGVESLKFSTLAQQLSASASRAEDRDKTLSLWELASKAKRIVNQIVGTMQIKHCTAARFLTAVTQELLYRTKQTKAYVNDAARGGHLLKKPFSGLSREQLSNIIYDESGTYTVSERHVAWRES